MGARHTIFVHPFWIYAAPQIAVLALLIGLRVWDG